MFRPKVTLENHEAVYRYYRHHRQSPASWLGYYAMDKITDAQVDHAPGVFSDIASHVGDGGKLAVVMNHLTDRDQNVIAGLAHLRPELRFLMGHTIIPSKPILFRYPGLRHGVDIMGAVPAWREKDDSTPEDKVLRTSAAEKLIDLCARRLEEDSHLAQFPEGTRNDTDPLKVQKIKMGLGNILVATEADVATLVVGLQYRAGSSRHPSVYIAPLVTDKPTSPQDVERFTIGLQASMQGAVEKAVEKLPKAV